MPRAPGSSERCAGALTVEPRRVDGPPTTPLASTEGMKVGLAATKPSGAVLWMRSPLFSVAVSVSRSHVEPLHVVGGNQAKYFAKTPLPCAAAARCAGRAAAPGPARTSRRSRRVRYDEETRKKRTQTLRDVRLSLLSGYRQADVRSAGRTGKPVRLRPSGDCIICSRRCRGRGVDGAQLTPRGRGPGPDGRSPGAADPRPPQAAPGPVNPAAEGSRSHRRRRSGARGPRC